MKLQSNETQVRDSNWVWLLADFLAYDLTPHSDNWNYIYCTCRLLQKNPL